MTDDDPNEAYEVVRRGRRRRGNSDGYRNP
jgi:hypothetical protein